VTATNAGPRVNDPHRRLDVPATNTKYVDSSTPGHHSAPDNTSIRRDAAEQPRRYAANRIPVIIAEQMGRAKGIKSVQDGARIAYAESNSQALCRASW